MIEWMLLAASEVGGGSQKPAWYAFVGMIGAAVGWILCQLKCRAEIQQLKAERDLHVVEKTKSLIEIRKLVEQSEERCAKALSLFSAAIREATPSEPEVSKYRDDALLTISSDMMCRYFDLAEMTLAVRQTPKSKGDFVRESVIPMLGKYERWIRVLNKPSLLDRYGMKRFKLGDETARQYRELLDYAPKRQRKQLSELLAKAIKSLNQAS